VADLYKQNVYQLKPDTGEVRAMPLRPCHPFSLAFDPTINGLYMTCLEEIIDTGNSVYRIRKKTFDGKINHVIYNAPQSTFARSIVISCTLSKVAHVENTILHLELNIYC